VLTCFFTAIQRKLPFRRAFTGSTWQSFPLRPAAYKAQFLRLKDQVHVQVMDAAGLITTEVEVTLSGELAARLQYVRETD